MQAMSLQNSKIQNPSPWSQLGLISLYAHYKCCHVATDHILLYQDYLKHKFNSDLKSYAKVMRQQYFWRPLTRGEKNKFIHFLSLVVTE